MIKIGGIQKSTLIDYPGRLAATIFLAGCNFRCPWCYSSELVLPEKIKNQPMISEKEIFSFLKTRKGLLEGVVICGGEPTLNTDLIQFCQGIKDLGFLIKLDTNGSNPDMLDFLIRNKLINYVAMDIKLPIERYPEVFGEEIRAEKIEKSINILSDGRVDFEFRTTVVPTIHTKEDVIKMAEWISSQLPFGRRKYYLQNFRAEKTIDSKFEEIQPYSSEFLLEIKKEISSLFDICEVR